MKTPFAIAVSLLLVQGSFAQAKPAQTKPSDVGRLELTCVQMLQMASTDWVSKFNKEKDASPQGTLRAIAAYGRCYDARTERLVASLAKTRKRPNATELKNLRDFDQALKDFTSKSLASTEPPGDAVKSAYAALYQKGFRYAFFQSYDTGAAKTALPAARSTEPASAPSATSSKTDKNDPFTKAKNRFGELLGLLPEDKRHEVHAAFGRMFAGNPVAEEMKLEIYRHAIFVLEPPSAKPFSPPAF